MSSVHSFPRLCKRFIAAERASMSVASAEYEGGM